MATIASMASAASMTSMVTIASIVTMASIATIATMAMMRRVADGDGPGHPGLQGSPRHTGHRHLATTLAGVASNKVPSS